MVKLTERMSDEEIKKSAEAHGMTKDEFKEGCKKMERVFESHPDINKQVKKEMSPEDMKKAAEAHNMSVEKISRKLLKNTLIWYSI